MDERAHGENAVADDQSLQKKDAKWEEEARREEGGEEREGKREGGQQKAGGEGKKSGKGERWEGTRKGREEKEGSHFPLWCLGLRCFGCGVPTTLTHELALPFLSFFLRAAGALFYRFSPKTTLAHFIYLDFNKRGEGRSALFLVAEGLTAWVQGLFFFFFFLFLPFLLFYFNLFHFFLSGGRVGGVDLTLDPKTGTPRRPRCSRVAGTTDGLPIVCMVHTIVLGRSSGTCAAVERCALVRY